MRVVFLSHAVQALAVFASLAVAACAQEPSTQQGQDSTSFTVQSGEEVVLDASGIFGGSSTATFYSWSQLSGPTVDIGDSSASKIRFVAPKVSAATYIVISMEASQSELSASTLYTVTVLPPDGVIEPMADAGTVDPEDGGAPTVPTDPSDSYVSHGMWINKAEIDQSPMSGDGWQEVKGVADSTWEPPSKLYDNNGNFDTDVLAGALVFLRTQQSKYRTKVAQALKAAIEEPFGNSNWLRPARNYASLPIAADLINLGSYDPELDERFRSWLTKARTHSFDGMSIIDCHETRLTNHGTMCGASRVAIAIYLGDTPYAGSKTAKFGNLSELDAAVQVWRGYLGDPSAYDGFRFSGDRSWFSDETILRGINPKGATKHIDGAVRNVDGVMVAEQYRCGTASWPPCQTNYTWGALQSLSVAFELLHRQGYGARTWADSALGRAFDRQWDWEQNVPASQPWWGNGGSSDSKWVTYLANYMYGTSRYVYRKAGKGKIFGWTEFTHGPRQKGNP